MSKFHEVFLFLPVRGGGDCVHCVTFRVPHSSAGVGPGRAAVLGSAEKPSTRFTCEAALAAPPLGSQLSCSYDGDVSACIESSRGLRMTRSVSHVLNRGQRVPARACKESFVPGGEGDKNISWRVCSWRSWEAAAESVVPRKPWAMHVTSSS